MTIVATGKTFTWNSFFGESGPVLGQTYTITETELLGGWEDTNNYLLTLRTTGLDGSIDIGSYGQKNITLKYVEGEYGSRTYEFTLGDRALSETVFLNDRIQLWNNNDPNNNRTEFQRYQPLEDLNGDGVYSGEEFRFDVNLEGTPLEINNAPEIVGETFKWADFFGETGVIFGQKYFITEKQILQGVEDPDGDLLTIFGVENNKTSRLIVGSYSPFSGSRRSIQAEYVDGEIGDRTWEFTFDDPSLLRRDSIEFTSFLVTDSEDPNNDLLNPQGVSIETRDANGDGVVDFLEREIPIDRTTPPTEAFPDSSPIEEGVEGIDYFYFKNQKQETTDVNTEGFGDIVDRNGIAQDGSYWLDVKNGVDDLIGNGQEIALVAGTRSQLNGAEGADILTGIEEGSLAASNSFASYDGVQMRASFGDGVLDSVLDSATAADERVYFAAIDAASGEVLGELQNGGTLQSQYDTAGLDLDRSLSARNDFAYGDILAANVDPII